MVINSAETSETFSRSGGGLFLDIVIKMVLFFIFGGAYPLLYFTSWNLKDMGTGEFCGFGDGGRKAQLIYLSHSDQRWKRVVLYCGFLNSGGTRLRLL